MAGRFSSWPYPTQCENCSGAWYDTSYGSTPYICQLHGIDGSTKAQGLSSAPLQCRDYREGKMKVAEGVNANMGYESRATTNGGKILEGTSQIARNILNDRPLSGDELVGGSMKIIGGLAGAAAKEFFGEEEEETEEEKEARRIRNASGLWEEVNGVNFDGTKQTVKDIKLLFGAYDEVYSCSDDTMHIEDREAIADTCLARLAEGIELLRNAPDDNAKKVDAFQIRLQKCNITRLKIQRDLGFLKSESHRDRLYKKNLILISGVIFTGGTKLIMKNLDSLFSVKTTIFSSFGGGKGINPSKKRHLCDTTIEKIEQGLAAFKNDPAFDEKKYEKYETELTDFRVKRNGITWRKEETFHEVMKKKIAANASLNGSFAFIAASIDVILSLKKAMFDMFSAEVGKEIANNISLDGNSVFIDAGLDAILSIKKVIFSRFGAGKEIIASDKREICDTAIGKLEQGIAILKKDPSFNAKKLTKYEAELADFRLKRETI